MNQDMAAKIQARFQKLWSKDPKQWQDAINATVGVLKDDYNISARDCRAQTDTFREIIDPLADRFERELNMPFGTGICVLSAIAFFIGLEMVTTTYATIQLADENMIRDVLAERGYDIEEDEDML